MVSSKKDLETRIIATDKASAVIGKVADNLETLEKKGDTAIDITAEDHATAEIKSLTQLLEGLSKEDQTIVLKARVSDAERDVQRLLRGLKDVDRMDQKTIDIRVNALGDARAELDRIQDELRQLDGETVDVKVEASGLDGVLSKLDSLPGKFGEMGSTLSSALGPLAAGGGAALGVTAIAAGLFAAAEHAADIAIEAQTMAKLTGDTVEDASKLQQVWKTTGADINDLNDIVVQINGAFAQTPELAGKLGVNLNDGRTAAERFVQVVDLVDQGLVSLNDQSALLGEEGVRQVAGLTSRYDDLAQILDGMDPLVTEEDAANALAMKKQIAEITVEFQNLAVQVGQFVVPAVDEAFHKLEPLVDLLGFLGDTALEDTAAQMKAVGEAIPVQDMEAMKEAGVDNLEAWEALGHMTRTVKLDTQATAVATADTATATADTAAVVAKTRDAFKATKLVVDAITAAQVDAAEAETERQQALVDNFKAMVTGLVDYRKALKSVDWKNIDIQAGIAGMEDFTEAHFGLATIAKDAADAEKQLADTVKENGVNFDLGTEAGRKNLEAIEAVARTVDTKLADAYDKANGNQEKFTKSAQNIADNVLGELSEQMGLSEEQTAQLAEALGLMPADIETRYELSGVAEAQLKLDLLSTSIDDLPDNVETKVTQKIIAGDYVGALQVVQDYYDANPAELTVHPVVRFGGYSYLTGGGALAAPAAAGLTAGTTAVTATATGGMSPFMIPVAAPSRSQPVVNLYTTLNAAVIGDPFEVARTVEDATRRTLRLMPTSH